MLIPCRGSLKPRQSIIDVDGISSSASWVQEQTEPSFTTRDWFLHTYLSLFSGNRKRRGKFCFSAASHICHKTGETRRQPAALFYTHHCSQCSSGEIGGSRWYKCLKPSKYLIPWHTPVQDWIYTCPKPEQWPQLKFPYFCPRHSLAFKPRVFQSLFLSDGFRNCPSCHSRDPQQVWSNTLI